MNNIQNKQLLFKAAKDIHQMLDLPLSLHLKMLEKRESNENEQIKYTLKKDGNTYKLKREIVNSQIIDEILFRKPF